MEHLDRGLTFGSAIAGARKKRFLTQSALLRRFAVLGELLDPRALNELEQDRVDPRKLPYFSKLLDALAAALEINKSELARLAADHDRAAQYQRYYQHRLEQEAIAFRARSIRG